MTFDTLTEMVSKIYNTPQEPFIRVYTPEQTLSLFGYYLMRYKQYMGESHPYISEKNTRRYIRMMPYLNTMRMWQDFDYLTITPDINREMTDQYFLTNFRREPDRRIGHFFSPGVRYRIYYDTCGSYDAGLMDEDDLSWTV